MGVLAANVVPASGALRVTDEDITRAELVLNRENTEGVVSITLSRLRNNTL